MVAPTDFVARLDRQPRARNHGRSADADEVNARRTFRGSKFCGSQYL